MSESNSFMYQMDAFTLLTNRVEPFHVRCWAPMILLFNLNCSWEMEMFLLYHKFPHVCSPTSDEHVKIIEICLKEKMNMDLFFSVRFLSHLS